MSATPFRRQTKTYIYTNPNLDCFYLTAKAYILPGLLKFYQMNKTGVDPTGIVLAYCNQIATIKIFENNLVMYTFNNQTREISEALDPQGIMALKDFLSCIGWRSVISYWSNDQLFNEM
jgi:hypothetical protein